MSHELATKADGTAAMAYVGETPWHSLGHQLKAGASIDEWKAAAGMDFTIEKSDVLYHHGAQRLPFTGNVVLHRKDTGKPLAVVSKTFKVVQPAEILEFYRNLTEKMGYQLETAGVLFGGAKYWALASIGEEANIQGQDKLKGYLLLATASDGTMATTAKHTSVRVVCNNTLQVAVGSHDNAVKISHRTQFNVNAVQAMLGIESTSWGSFVDDINLLASVHLAEEEAVRLIAKLYGAKNDDEVESTMQHVRAASDVLELYQGAAQGAQLDTANGTAWGLMNAVTEYYDWHRNTKTTDARIDKAWFGDGANAKRKMWNNLIEVTM